MGNRPDILGRGQALSGDETTTGAKLIPSLSVGNILGRRPIVLGDKTTPCPKCGKVGTVAEGEGRKKILDIPVAVNGGIVVCDCLQGSNKIIAPLGWIGPGESPAQIAAKHQAEGRKAMEATAALAAEEAVRRLVPVFAKSRERGTGNTDAGKQQEPHSNFAEMGFFRAAPVSDPPTDSDTPQHAQTAKKKQPAPEDIPKPKKRSALYKWWNGNHEEIDYQAAVAAAASATRVQTATAGVSVLEQVAGRFATYGTWAVRGAEIATAGAGASVAGFLVAMMPGRLNDGEQDFIDRMRLSQMSEAPTRVRFSWENDVNGNPEPHGWHTPPGKDMVRVRKMQWNNNREAYTFTTEEENPVTIIWTPEQSGTNKPWNTGNQTPPRLPSSVVVDPLPENTKITTTSNPSPDEKSFADYILILPVTDIPPIYIYLSKNPNDPIWTKTKSSEPVENAYGHWVKHGHEFQNKSFNNSKEYVDATHDFVRTPPAGTLTKVRQNGDVMYYHPATNTFSVKTKDGVPKTMFKPKGGLEYWEKQK